MAVQFRMLVPSCLQWVLPLLSRPVDQFADSFEYSSSSFDSCITSSAAAEAVTIPSSTHHRAGQVPTAIRHRRRILPPPRLPSPSS